MTAVSIRIAMTAAALGAFLPGQTYQKDVLLQNLQQPTGIHVAADGTLYFTDVPSPGTMGGANPNLVVARDPVSGTLTTIASGEPMPVNLTMDAAGDLYWTCQTAGVILRRSGGVNAVWLQGLAEPTGIAADGSGGIYITQLPTPGVPGSMAGMNTVDRISNGLLTNVSTGEPEPYDITVAQSGTVYWTCRSAGVILAYDPATQQKELLLDGLDAPTGIAVDHDGNLYFTEVPTPGVPGSMGGENKVWKYDPATAQLTLLSTGEPEPVDITVLPDGSEVYWTCRTAGVILRATRTGPAPETKGFGSAQGGSTMRFFLDAPGSGGAIYLAASSLGRGPIVLGQRHIALTQDCVFAGTFLNAGAPDVTGYFGILDSNGMGTAQLVLSSSPVLAGVRVFTSFVVLDPAAPLGLGAIASTHQFAIQ